MGNSLETSLDQTVYIKRAYPELFFQINCTNETALRAPFNDK